MSNNFHQEPPFAVQIELVEGCNLRCDFCGINGIRGKELTYKYMTPQVSVRIAQLLRENKAWNPRIEFAMHGEPSLYPFLRKTIAVFRSLLPNHHLMLTTNGTGLLPDPTIIINDLMNNLNVLAIDHYEHVQIVPKILEKYVATLYPVHYYPQEESCNPHTRRKPNDKLLVIVEDIRKAKSGTHSVLNNHAGCAAPLNSSQQGKRCAKPFREMSIRWDGSVAICCNDWRGVYQCGNVSEQTLEEVWQSKPFQAARKKLYHGQRDFGPCQGCDAKSYRPGLLPDKKGKQELPLPDSQDLSTISQVLQQPLLSLSVLRPWENKEGTESK